MFTAGRLGELLAQLADEDIDDFELWLVHSAIKMVEKHLFRQRGALTQAKQLENTVFFPSQVNRLILD